MLKSLFRAGFAITALSLAAGAHAGLIGQPISGVLNFNVPGNYFDPALGGVPAGFLNSAGATVTVGEPAIEFGYADQSNRDVANFTDTQLIISDTLLQSSDNSPITMRFTSATAGLLLAIDEVSDTFGNGGFTASLLGDTLKLVWAGQTSLQAGQQFQAVYNITTRGSSVPVPEPATLALVGLALLGTALARLCAR